MSVGDFMLSSDLPKKAGHCRGTETDETTAAKKDGQFFPTEWEGSEAFMRAEGDYIRRRFGKVHECACGDGAMSRVIWKHGIDVISTDLIDRGYGTGGHDFLKLKERRCRAIVTNPPYEPYPARFVRHAHALGYEYVALLLKADWLHTKDRLSIWHELPPTYCYPLSFRLDFLGLGRPVMNCTWFVWNWHSARCFCQDQGCIIRDVLPKPQRHETLALGLEALS